MAPSAQFWSLNPAPSFCRLYEVLRLLCSCSWYSTISPGEGLSLFRLEQTEDVESFKISSIIRFPCWFRSPESLLTIPLLFRSCITTRFRSGNWVHGQSVSMRSCPHMKLSFISVEEGPWENSLLCSCECICFCKMISVILWEGGQKLDTSIPYHRPDIRVPQKQALLIRTTWRREARSVLLREIA